MLNNVSIAQPAGTSSAVQPMPSTPVLAQPQHAVHFSPIVPTQAGGDGSLRLRHGYQFNNDPFTGSGDNVATGSSGMLFVANTQVCF